MSKRLLTELMVILFCILITIPFLFGLNKIKKTNDFKSKYIDIVYPDSTNLTGVITKIKTEKIKKSGDAFYSHSNRVFFETLDNQKYSILSDELIFSVKDTIKVITTPVYKNFTRSKSKIYLSSDTSKYIVSYSNLVNQDEYDKFVKDLEEFKNK